MCVFNVTEPTPAIYKAKGHHTGNAIIIIPRCDYSVVAIHHEGHEIANVLSKQGNTASVLKYRLPCPNNSDQSELVSLNDGRRALKLRREYSGKYGIDKEKDGVIDFSTGSHLATVSHLWQIERKAGNADISALINGISYLSDQHLNWQEESWYFRKLTPEEVIRNKLLEWLSENSPRAFLVHIYDNEVFHKEETTLYAQELLAHHVSAKVYLLPKGGNGFGMEQKEDGTDQWLGIV